MNRLGKFFRKTYDKILDIFFPIDKICIFCNKEIVDFKEKPYCESCEKEVFNNGNKCIKCDTKIKDGNIVCDNCKSHKRNFEKCLCPLNYENNVRKSILKFKDDNAIYLAKSYAKIIYEYLNHHQIKFDVVTFVPSHKSKIKKRGYNPAQVLAEELAKLCNKEVKETLAKVTLTQSQKTLSFADRQQNLKNSIIVTNSKSIKSKTILLVDDIITTCATVDYCSKLLKDYANKVFVCSIARNHITKNDIKNLNSDKKMIEI